MTKECEKPSWQADENIKVNIHSFYIFHFLWFLFVLFDDLIRCDLFGFGNIYAPEGSFNALKLRFIVVNTEFHQLSAILSSYGWLTEFFQEIHSEMKSLIIVT